MIREFTYNNRVLTAEEREEYCKIADEYIDKYSGFIEEIFQLSKEVAASVSESSDSAEINRTMLEFLAFTTFAVCDGIVLNKLFVRATNPYEKSFLRGKWKVHLNESFKKLYGFKDGYKNSYCAKLEQIINRFFPGFKGKFDELMVDFEQLSKEPWWKEERNAEVHVDVAKLYELRHEEINKSKVVMEERQLTSLIRRLDVFTRDVYGTYLNYIKAQFLKENGYFSPKSALITAPPQPCGSLSTDS